MKTTLSCIFIVCALLLSNSAFALTSYDLGYKADDMMGDNDYHDKYAKIIEIVKNHWYKYGGKYEDEYEMEFEWGGYEIEVECEEGKCELEVEWGDHEVEFEYALGKEYNHRPMKPVPVPASVLLFGSAILGMVGLSRHKKAS